jgi:hypothetical protein
MKLPPRRRPLGTSIAELPVTLWVFIFFMVMPLIDLVTIGCRATLAYSGVREATTKAALESSFTKSIAKAGSVLGANGASWTGVSYSNTKVYVVQVNQAGVEIEGAADTPWAAIIDQQDVYLIRLRTSASLNPLINLAPSGTWNSVPGLTSPLTLQFTYQVSSENPQGLVN